MFEVINYQAPYTADSLREYMRGTSIALTTCWKLTPVDSHNDPLFEQAVGATAATRNLKLPGHLNTFKMNGGLDVSVVDTEAGQGSAGLDLQSIFTLDISEQDIAKRKWEHAIFEVFTINPNALKMGQYVDFSGRIRKVTAQGFMYKASAAPLTELYGNVYFGRVTKFRCDVRRFADKYYENRCKIDPLSIAPDGYPITLSGTVTTGGTNTDFIDAARTEPVLFDNGVLKFTSGDLNGIEVEIRSFDTGIKKFTLQLPLTEIITAGTTYEVVRACDRTPTMCAAYNNIINYRGFPKIAGIEGLARIQRATV